MRIDRIKRLNAWTRRMQGWVSALLFPFYSLSMFSGRQKRCLVLVYHNVTEISQDPFSVFPDAFRAQMRYLAAKSEVVALEEWLDNRWNRSRKPSVILTFDDGYRSLKTLIDPVLASHGFPAHVFIPVSLVGNEYRPDPGSSGSRDQEILNWNELKELKARGWGIGSHTMSHSRIGVFTQERLAWELRESKKVLESRLNIKVRTFAYPYSLLGGGVRRSDQEKIERLIRTAGYDAAFSTDRGRNDSRTDPMRFKRIQVLGSDSIFLFKAKVIGAFDWTGTIQRIVRGILEFLPHEGSTGGSPNSG